jgi:hypothetical protein
MRSESSDELVARVIREQELLNPTPVYTARSKRRLRVYLVTIVPLSIVLGWLAGALLGWSAIESLGFGAGLILAFAYIGLVLLTERDDGRIHDETQRVVDTHAQDR